jgi:amidase
MGNKQAVYQKKIRERIHEKLFAKGATELNFSDEELAVCELPATELRVKLLDKSSGITLDKLIKLYHYKKQLHKNQDNALTDVFYFEPLGRAKNLQEVIDSGDITSLEALPLLGFVISLKDTVKYKGSDSTWGFFENVNKPSTESAPLIDYLEAKGAIVTCKGNIAMALEMVESNNKVFGMVKNPFDESRSAGGSSGGEAALIANRLVNASVGSDIGGSLRVPSFSCGTYTLKPTAGRFTKAETEIWGSIERYGRVGETQPLLFSTIGPMTHNMEDLEVFSKALAEFYAYDMRLPPLPWKIISESPKLIGVITEAKEFLEICPTMKRAIAEVRETLTNNNFQLVEVNLETF